MPWFRSWPAIALVYLSSWLSGCGQGECECPCGGGETGGVPATGTGGAGWGEASGGAASGGTGSTSPLQLSANQWGTVTLTALQHEFELYTRVTFSDTPMVLSPECTVVDMGICSTRVCPESLDSASVNQPHAGPITVVSQSVVGQALLQPDAQGLYDVTTISFPLDYFFPGGERLSFTAAGGGVPAFETTLSFPASLAITQPLGDETGEILASRDNPLTLILQGGDIGDELLVAGQVARSGLEYTLVCNIPVAPSVTIPAESLAPLPPQMPLAVYRMRREVLTVPPYEITVRLVGDVDNLDSTAAVSVFVP